MCEHCEEFPNTGTLHPNPNRTITGWKSWANPANVRRVNIEYLRIKQSFIEASEGKTRELWQKVQTEYVWYCNHIYENDIDALIELGEASTHLMQYQTAIDCFEKAFTRQKNNPFHKIRVGENYAKKTANGKALEQFEMILQDEKADGKSDEDLRSILIKCAILAYKMNDGKKIEAYAKRLEKIGKNAIAKDIRKALTKNKSADHVTPKAFASQEKMLYTKGQGNRSHNLPRDGVLMMLLMWPRGATRNLIKERLLNNHDTTIEILDELKKRELIDSERMADTNNSDVYFLTESGKNRAKYLHYMFEQFKDQEVQKERRKGKNTPEKRYFWTLYDKIIEWEGIHDKNKTGWNEKKEDYMVEVKDKILDEWEKNNE